VTCRRAPAFRALATPLAALAAVAACNERRGGETPTATATAAVLSSADAGPDRPPDATSTDGPIDRDASTAAELRVPLAPARIVPTGHFDVHLWSGAVRTGTLLDKSRLGAVPVSEARLLWGAGALYLFFYAGDLDLQAHAAKHDGPVWNDDSVALTFAQADETKRVIQISVTGVVADGTCPGDAPGLSDPRCDLRWESGVRVGTDSDGTLNRIGDNDEEWAVEAAVPLATIGGRAVAAGARIPFRIDRCEVAYDGRRACGAWGDREGGGVLVLQGR
jgi:hypothetical protein